MKPAVTLKHLDDDLEDVLVESEFRELLVIHSRHQIADDEHRLLVDLSLQVPVRLKDVYDSGDYVIFKHCVNVLGPAASQVGDRPKALLGQSILLVAPLLIRALIVI